MAKEEASTTPCILLPTLRSLALEVEPKKILVDCGGHGQCGPNTLAYLLGLVGIFDGTGEGLRMAVVQHVGSQYVLAGNTNLKKTHASTDILTMRGLKENSISAWPNSLLEGFPPTVETWVELIRRKGSCADRFLVCFALTGVDDL